MPLGDREHFYFPLS